MLSFTTLNISGELKRAISDAGFINASPIQESSIPKLLDQATDFLGVAATGTGKTAAFLIPSLAKIDKSQSGTQFLIICPTRELAKQIADSLLSLSKYQGIRHALIYGGTSYDRQFEDLSRKPHFIIGTPGRLLDHLERGSINLNSLKALILDEADEMISLGFKDDIESLLTHIKKHGSRPNTWLFTATMHGEVARIADSFLYNPVKVELTKNTGSSDSVEQHYYVVRDRDKTEAITRILDHEDDFYGMIFCQTKKSVEELTSFLLKRKFPVMELHGDKTQREREITMQRFREKSCKILVCTDVAARGIDVKNLTCIVNHTLPRELDSYIHRIGRTGRQGEKGKSISLVTPDRLGLIKRLEKLTKSPMIRSEVPSAKSVLNKKIKRLVDNILSVDQTKMAVFSEPVFGVETEPLKKLPAEELIARFCAYYDKELFRAFKVDDSDIAPVHHDSDRPERFRRESRGGGYGRDSRNDHRRSRGSRGRKFGEGKKEFANDRFLSKKKRKH